MTTTQTNTGTVVSRGPIEHRLKCWPGPFRGLVSGAKKFEYRKNDRDYRVGDTLLLEEYDQHEQAYTSVQVRRRITWISNGPDWGIPKGFVVMSVEPL